MFNIDNTPNELKYILYHFNRVACYPTYLCGGCVRDMFIGKEPDDYDICTSATPDEIIKEIKALKYIESQYNECGSEYNKIDYIPTGLKHGTITIVINEYQFEITTFRIDGDYSDSRRPDEVIFTKDIVKDLSRRDFTVNAIAYNYFDDEIIDPFNGIRDIKEKVIRCVGNPDDRFKEDGLRILRAIRFASQLGFKIDESTAKAIYKNKFMLYDISRERIQSEIFKILSSPYCGCDEIRNYKDIFTLIIPELYPMIGFKQNNPYHLYDVWEHTLHCLEFLSNSVTGEDFDDISLRLAILLHDIGKPVCYTEDANGIGHFYGHAKVSEEVTRIILKELKCSNEIIRNVCELIHYHDVTFTVNKSFVKRMLNKIGEEQFRRLLLLRKCDLHGQKADYERLIKPSEITVILNDIIIENECFKLKDLDVNGNDLIKHGIPEGKIIGNILNELLVMVIDGEIANEKDKLLEMTDLILKSKNKVICNES